MLMAVKQSIDFHRVAPEHAEIHARLENWAKWCNGSGAPSISPMFRMYRSPARARGAEHTWAADAVNGADGARVARFVGLLPEKHRRALNWSYLKPINPRRAASEIGTTLEGLAQLVRDARQMLVNRGA